MWGKLNPAVHAARPGYGWLLVCTSLPERLRTPDKLDRLQVWAFAEGNGYLSANTEAYLCAPCLRLPC